MEKTSLRDPMRSDTFTGPSAGHSGRIVGPTRPLLQHDFQKIYAKKNLSERGKVVLANREVGWDAYWSKNIRQARAAFPRNISYRSITAATPIRALPSSIRRSTRTTLPRARIKTAEPCVFSPER